MKIKKCNFIFYIDPTGYDILMELVDNTVHYLISNDAGKFRKEAKKTETQEELAKCIWRWDTYMDSDEWDRFMSEANDYINCVDPNTEYYTLMKIVEESKDYLDSTGADSFRKDALKKSNLKVLVKCIWDWDRFMVSDGWNQFKEYAKDYL